MAMQYRIGAQLWAKAAEQGHAGAQYELGNLYFHGDGVPEDKQRAAEWYTKSASQGHVEAQCRLGVMYFSADGVPEDKRRAAEWWAKAAAQGHPGAVKALRACKARDERTLKVLPLHACSSFP